MTQPDPIDELTNYGQALYALIVQVILVELGQTGP
jgi:hypothetical protein